MADSPSTPLLGEEKEKEGGGKDRLGLKTESNTEREEAAETLGHKDKGDGSKSKNSSLSGESGVPVPVFTKLACCFSGCNF